mmetsp:Transcript_28625/g.85156  ORF Transcript_28625/g.85156 Transcript_28625/m.85156 type:complete len:229 (+) Transcript_28625:636-1322(+)
MFGWHRPLQMFSSASSWLRKAQSSSFPSSRTALLTANRFPVSWSRALYTQPYEPDPSFCPRFHESPDCAGGEPEPPDVPRESTVGLGVSAGATASGECDAAGEPSGSAPWSARVLSGVRSTCHVRVRRLGRFSGPGGLQEAGAASGVGGALPSSGSSSRPAQVQVLWRRLERSLLETLPLQLLPRSRRAFSGRRSATSSCGDVRFHRCVRPVQQWRGSRASSSGRATL